jgi:hypothetical protein
MASEKDPLFLQVKEARASVLEAYAGKSTYANHGQRVVNGYRKSDIFDKAIAEFANAYADQSERDHAVLKKAARSGRIEVLTETDR